MTTEFIARISPREFAERNGLHVNTIYYWIKEGILPCRKVRKNILIDPIEAEAALSKFDLNTQTTRR